MLSRSLALGALSLCLAALCAIVSPTCCALPPLPDAGPPFDNDVPLSGSDGGGASGFSCEAVCGHESALCTGIYVPTCAQSCEATLDQSVRACAMAAVDCPGVGSCLADAGVGLPGDGGP